MSQQAHDAPARRGRPRAGTGSRFAAWRDHVPFLVVLAIGIVLRVVAHLAYRPALFFNDSFGYLDNVDELDPGLLWPMGYSLFIKPLLVFDDLAVLPAVNHLLGLATAIVLYVTLRRWTVSRWPAALATVPVLLDAAWLQSEHRILSETLFTALLVAALLVVSWRWGDEHADGRGVLGTGGAGDAGLRHGIVAAGVAGLLIGLAATTRLIGAVVVAAVVVAVVVDRRDWGSTLLRVAALVVAAVIPLAAYAAWYDHVHDRWALSPEWNAPRVLYARTARFVDCDLLDVPDWQRGLCPTPQQQATLSTDEFNWGQDSPLNNWEPPAGVDKHEAVGQFAWRAVRGQPVALARWVTVDVLAAFSPTRHERVYDPLLWRWRFQVDRPWDQQRAQEAVATHGGADFEYVQPWAGMLRSYQLTIGEVPPILFGAALLLGLAGGVVALRRGGRDTAARCLLFGGAGLALVVASALYQFSWRYQLPTFAMFPPAGALGWTVLRGRALLPGGTGDRSGVSVDRR